MLNLLRKFFDGQSARENQGQPEMTLSPEEITAEVEIYTTMFCGFCWRAKELLQTKGVNFKEYDVSSDAALRSTMQERSNGGRTVPQIFIDGKSVGGCDELYQMEFEGKLDPMLKGAA